MTKVQQILSKVHKDLTEAKAKLSASFENHLKSGDLKTSIEELQAINCLIEALAQVAMAEEMVS